MTNLILQSALRAFTVEPAYPAFQTIQQRNKRKGRRQTPRDVINHLTDVERAHVLERGHRSQYQLMRITFVRAIPIAAYIFSNPVGFARSTSHPPPARIKIKHGQ